MIRELRNLARDESGGALVEYALVLTLVSMVAFGALMAFGNVLSDLFVTSAADLTATAEFAK